MQKVHWFLALVVTALLCGCSQQTQRNTEKIDVLTQKMFILQQAQSKQLEAIQTQLAALPPVLDKLEKKYSDEIQSKALFYHTNALYFMVAIDKRIQAQFDQATIARKASDQLAYFYHTNETDNAFFCSSQIANTISAQEKRIEDNISNNIRQMNTALSHMNTSLSNRLSGQIQTLETLASDKTQIQAVAAKQAALETKLTQIQGELDQMKALLQRINPPATNIPSSATNTPASRP